MSDAKHLKEEGNKFFNEGNYGEALACYTKAMSISGVTDSEKATFLRNRAACFLKLNKDVEAITDCTAGKFIFKVDIKDKRDDTEVINSFLLLLENSIVENW
jgi:hypothetical protein